KHPQITNVRTVALHGAVGTFDDPDQHGCTFDAGRNQPLPSGPNGCVWSSRRTRTNFCARRQMMTPTRPARSGCMLLGRMRTCLPVLLVITALLVPLHQAAVEFDALAIQLADRVDHVAGEEHFGLRVVGMELAVDDVGLVVGSDVLETCDCITKSGNTSAECQNHACNARNSMATLVPTARVAEQHNYQHGSDDDGDEKHEHFRTPFW